MAGVDREATQEVGLGRLGVEVATLGNETTVAGTGGDLRPGPAILHARLAGTTSRFVTALAALGPGPYTVDGFGPLRARPMADLHAALSTLGATVVHTERAGHLPVVLSRSGLTGGTKRPVRSGPAGPPMTVAGLEAADG